MRWWYFIREEDEIILASEDEFPDRPLDALPSKGDYHRPWYKLQDHIDAEHVHVKAKDYDAAYNKAKKMIEKEY